MEPCLDLKHLMFSILALLWMITTLSSSASAAWLQPPIRVGFMTWFQETADPNIKLVLKPALDGMYAAVLGVNAEGGINGRELQVVTCDVAYTNVSVDACMVNFTLNMPDVLAMLPIIGDGSLDTVLPRLRVARLLAIGPLITLDHPFETAFIFTRADTRLQLLSLVKMAVSEGHNRRIGLIWSNNSGTGSSYVEDTRGILSDLGLDLVGSYSVDFYLSSFRWKNQAYVDFLATRPQALLFVCPGSTSAGEFLFDVISKSVRGVEVDPNLKILCLDQMAIGIPLVLQSLKLFGYKFDPSGRIFVATSNPLLMDKRYGASRHAFHDLTSYHNGSTAFAANNIGYHLVTMLMWVATRTAAAALRSVPPGNVTRESLLNKVFDTGIFAIDDLVLGPYAGTCSGVRAQLGMACECNSGYHIVELYTFNNTEYVPIENAQAVTPLTKCSSIGESIVKPLVYLVARTKDEMSTTASRLILSGQAAQEQGNAAALRASLELVVGDNTSDLAAQVAAAEKDKYVSAMVASFVDPSSTFTDGLPLFDPLTLPAALAPPFRHNVLHVFATLQQEIHVLCNFFAVARGARSFAAVLIGPQALQIAAIVEKSANTFGAVLSLRLLITVDTDSASVVEGLSAAASLSSPTFLFGVTNASTVAAVSTFLRTHNDVQVLLPFVALSLLYDSWSVALAGVEGQVFFASSLRNWNAASMPSNMESSLMQAYFAACSSSGSSSCARHPLTLRGFFLSGAIQQLVSQLYVAKTPDAILRSVYALSVLAVSPSDIVGPFSNASCDAVATSQGVVLCEANVGARQVFVMSVADVTVNSSTVRNYLWATTFSSATISYSPLPTGASWEISARALAAICAGVAIFLLLLSAFNKLRQTNRFKQLMLRGLWMLCVRVMVNFADITVNILSCIAVVSASKSTTFTLFFLLLTCMAILAVCGEVAVLIGYFLALVEANDDLSEEAMLAWNVMFAKSAVVSLGVSGVPVIVITFVALLRLDMSVFVLLSFAAACFFAGTKVRFLKEVISLVVKRLRRPERRFRTLRDVAAFVRILIRSTSWSPSTIRLNYMSTLAEVKAFRDNCIASNSDRFTEIQNRAKSIAIELKRSEVNGGEYFGIVHPYLAGDFDPSYGPSLAATTGYKRKLSAVRPQVAISSTSCSIGNPLNGNLPAFSAPVEKALPVENGTQKGNQEEEGEVQWTHY